MSGKKKREKKPSIKKAGKYDIELKVNATFEELLKAGLNGVPQESTAKKVG